MSKITGQSSLAEVVDEVTRRYRSRMRAAANVWWADVDDMKQEAWLAVLEAQQTHDPARGVELSWYAWRAALYAVKNMTWRMSSAAHVPQKKQQLARELRRVPVDNEAPAIDRTADEKLHDLRWQKAVEQQVNQALLQAPHGAALKRILINGEKPVDVAADLGMDVTALWRATGNVRRRMKIDPLLQEVMAGR